jgi:beta-glucosidase
MSLCDKKVSVMKRLIQIVLISAIIIPSCGGGGNSGLKDVDPKVDSLLRIMTLDEKIGQMVLFTSDWDVTGPTIKEGYLDDIRSGRCGNIFNAYTTDYIREIQRVAVEESRLGIPLLFGYDVVHGHKTIFPVPLAESCSWDLDLMRRTASASAAEAAASGLNWTFAPMVDISVDPRWGRVCEGAGEDPFLASLIADARVKGFQGDDLSDPLTVLACVKHFAAYGAPLAGRDYNTVDMSERQFREFYLPPYKAGVDAGALSVMTSFNEYDGVPSTGNAYLIRTLLKKDWGFQGFVVTDYTSINEMVHHGYAASEADAGVKAVNAGVDMDLQGEVYFNYLKGLVGAGFVSMRTIDHAVARILNVKAELGLFDDPYRYCDSAREADVVENQKIRSLSREAARKSMVLLKNDGTLPFDRGDRIAVIGELAASKRDLLGSWKAAGEWDQMKSILDAVREYNGAANVFYAEGCKKMGTDRSGFGAALEAVAQADKVLMVIGEDWDWSGEAASRTDISVPGVQSELLSMIAATGKPVAVVLLNGRPLVLEKENVDADALLEAWYPGTMGADAVTDILFGQYNPSGKLTMTFPRSVGQIPIFYYEKNTGRPIYLPSEKYKSRYLDSPNDPLYPFGYGLSYTTFSYSDLSLSSPKVKKGKTIEATVTVTNTGQVTGEETVQLYIRDLVGSVTRPVKLLKAFQKVAIPPGESRRITFTIDNDMLSFWRQDMTFGVEEGDFKVMVGGSSADLLQASFTLVP